MKNQIIAKVYAKALMTIAKDKKINIAEEIIKLTETINSSNQLENVLFLDVFSNDEKKAVFQDIAKKISLDESITESINFLI